MESSEATKQPIYEVKLTASAAKELKALPKEAIIKIGDSLLELQYNPYPPGCKKLKGRNDYWRKRTGNYRIIYTVEQKVLLIEVITIGDRKDIYKKK